MTISWRTSLIRLAAVIAAGAVALGLAALRPRPASATASLGALDSQLAHEHALQSSLTSSVSTLNGLISSLSGQIQLVQSREAAVRTELASDEADLARVQLELVRERRRLALLRRRLAFARMLLSRQLVSSYEGDKPDLVSVVLNADGFNNLLDQVAFLGQAERQQQTIIGVTRTAKNQADRAARQLAALQSTDRQLTERTALRAKALQGMNVLLSARQDALGHARSAQQAALAASQIRGRALESQIAQVRAAQLAAQQAAARAAAAATAQPTAPLALGPSGGWAIPYAIVLCESGGQNLPPNSAGASGYYQIIPSTWSLFGGTGPAAYLASKAEQDAIAAKIWNGGAGASNWVCAGIVGIH
jgi:septal ring factor EnvC (AmiA/AmiB activator)